MTMQDRMARAEEYVLGLMDEHERERAERDMEVDAEFRDCVVQLADRLRLLHEARRPGGSGDAGWGDLSERLAGLPQMTGSPTGRKPAVASSPPVGLGLHSLGGRRGLIVVAALAAAFALGFLAGRFTWPI